MSGNYRMLETVDEWNDLYKSSLEKPVLVFKHSTTCPISAGAHEELSNWLEDAGKPKFDAVLVRVIEERPVSNAIAETLELKHASPQAIFIEKGKVSWHKSHWNITYSALEEQLGQHCEK